MKHEPFIFDLRNLHLLYPLDKYIEQVEEIKTLYKALIKEKDEKIALLEKMGGKK